uniref:Uncharacterized protein n=1 Tax=Coccidioides posadasii RMSCC 3488 TaxID=454284 RepID=A0A0J6FDF1_COCPO|nr:hypothetical protein CPAG_04662 [Coccidioides posadasii RMSCC 3488]
MSYRVPRLCELNPPPKCHGPLLWRFQSEKGLKLGIEKYHGQVDAPVILHSWNLRFALEKTPRVLLSYFKRVVIICFVPQLHPLVLPMPTLIEDKSKRGEWGYTMDMTYFSFQAEPEAIGFCGGQDWNRASTRSIHLSNIGGHYEQRRVSTGCAEPSKDSGEVLPSKFMHRKQAMKHKPWSRWDGPHRRPKGTLLSARSMANAVGVK